MALTHSDEAATLVKDIMEKAARCFVTVLPIPGEVVVAARWEK